MASSLSEPVEGEGAITGGLFQRSLLSVLLVVLLLVADRLSRCRASSGSVLECALVPQAGADRVPPASATVAAIIDDESDGEELPAEIASRVFTLYPAGTTQPLASELELEVISAIRHASRKRLAGVRSLEVSSDIRILRFLRGFSSVREAYESYCRMLRWRTENHMDDVRDAVMGLSFEVSALPYGELIAPSYPCELSAATTADGHVVSIDFVGRANVEALVQQVGVEKTEDWFRHFFELRSLVMDAESVRRGHLVQSVQVKDLRGLTLSIVRSADGRTGLALVRRILVTATLYYPESALCLFVLNTPSFFLLVWGALKSVLPARTVAKVRILGSGTCDELAALMGTSGALGPALGSSCG